MAAMATARTMTASRSWYVVYSKPHHERLARLHLERQGIEVFYPQLLLPLYAGPRRRVVPLFPNYLFIKIDLREHFRGVVFAPGVKQFVGVNGGITSLDDEVVAFLKGQASADGVLSARSNLKVGDPVEITAGPFAGVAAIIEDPPDSRGRVKVLMQLLSGRAIHADVPVQFVKTGWVV
jgi:transcriptional antiterminator RfaH